MRTSRWHRPLHPRHHPEDLLQIHDSVHILLAIFWNSNSGYEVRLIGRVFAFCVCSLALSHFSQNSTAISRLSWQYSFSPLWGTHDTDPLRQHLCHRSLRCLSSPLPSSTQAAYAAAPRASIQCPDPPTTAPSATATASMAFFIRRALTASLKPSLSFYTTPYEQCISTFTSTIVSKTKLKKWATTDLWHHLQQYVITKTFLSLVFLRNYSYLV